MKVIDGQGELVEADLQLLRDGNTITESERDVEFIEFKRRVTQEVRTVKQEVERLGRVFGRD